MQNYLIQMEKTYMKRWFVFVVLLFSAFFVFVVPAHSKENDDNDKVTLTINATCVADSKLSDPNGLSLKDKITAILSERAVYRIVAVEGGLLDLELINNSDTVQISGGGTYKDPTESKSWT